MLYDTTNGGEREIAVAEGLSFSPDGKSIAWFNNKYEKYEDFSEASIGLYRLGDGGTRTVLGSGDLERGYAIYEGPVWSRDSSSIYFSAAYEGSPNSGVFKVDVEAATSHDPGSAGMCSNCHRTARGCW